MSVVPPILGPFPQPISSSNIKDQWVKKSIFSSSPKIQILNISGKKPIDIVTKLNLTDRQELSGRYIQIKIDDGRQIYKTYVKIDELSRALGVKSQVIKEHIDNNKLVELINKHNDYADKFLKKSKAFKEELLNKTAMLVNQLTPSRFSFLNKKTRQSLQSVAHLMKPDQIQSLLTRFDRIKPKILLKTLVSIGKQLDSHSPQKDDKILEGQVGERLSYIISKKGDVYIQDGSELGRGSFKTVKNAINLGTGEEIAWSMIGQKGVAVEDNDFRLFLQSLGINPAILKATEQPIQKNASVSQANAPPIEERNNETQVQEANQTVEIESRDEEVEVSDDDEEVVSDVDGADTMELDIDTLDIDETGSTDGKDGVDEVLEEVDLLRNLHKQGIQHLVPAYEVSVVQEGRFDQKKLVLLQKKLSRGSDLVSKDVRQLVRVGKHVAEGLDSMHQRGYIHMDIKPDNILFNGQGVRAQGYIHDFGTVVSSGQKVHSGTPAYMPPESMLRNALNPSYIPTGLADAFALGVTLYEAVSGKNGGEESARGYTKTVVFGAMTQEKIDQTIRQEIEKIRTGQDDVERNQKLEELQQNAKEVENRLLTLKNNAKREFQSSEFRKSSATSQRNTIADYIRQMKPLAENLAHINNQIKQLQNLQGRTTEERAQAVRVLEVANQLMVVNINASPASVDGAPARVRMSCGWAAEQLAIIEEE